MSIRPSVIADSASTRAGGIGLRVGLHSQTLGREDGVVAGSEVTTLGLARAFDAHPEVGGVARYGPDRYSGLAEERLDLVVIEGWHESLPRFVRQVKDSHPGAKILFWNLSLFGIRGVLRLGVDGYLTNSKKAVETLEKTAPARFVMLAADHEEFRPSAPDPGYSHEVAYLGMYHPGKSASVVERMLGESSGYGLAIYGSGWDRHPVLSRCWRGVLPFEDVPKLYSSAKVVLGMTEERQKVAGMINNRAFEALSCGACFVSEYFPALEEVFGDAVLYSRRRGDTSRHLDRLLGDDSLRQEMASRGRELILKSHTYAQRTEEILSFFRLLSGAGP